MADEDSEWRSLLQILPLGLYERWQVQMKRIARCNGISIEAFDKADKRSKEDTGPRVMAYEALLVLIERSDDSTLRV
jgi:hypothetical protein